MANYIVLNYKYKIVIKKKKMINAPFAVDRYKTNEMHVYVIKLH